MKARQRANLNSHGIYRFASSTPQNKIYGRLDFLSPLGNRKQSKRTLHRESAKLPLNTSRSLLDRSATISFHEHDKLKQTAASNQSTSIRDAAKLDLRSTSKSFRRLQVSRQNPHRSLQTSTDNPQAGATQYAKHIAPSVKQLETSELKTTKNSLLSKSTKMSPADYHRPNCVCDHCNCGRHLCKFETIVPSMQVDSIYHKEFSPRKALPGLAFKPNEATTLSPVNPAVDLVSTYLGDYRKKHTAVPNLHHPHDNLQFKGPSYHSSTYRNEHPGFSGDNQYVISSVMQVKPTNKHYLEGVPFGGNSIYRKAYLPQLNPPSSPEKFTKQDSLKNLALWLGDSSYRSNYHPPAQRYYPKLEGRKVDKYDPSPDVSARFETIYRNEFNSKPQTICKANEMLNRSASKELSRSGGIFMPMEFTSPSRHGKHSHQAQKS